MKMIKDYSRKTSVAMLISIVLSITAIGQNKPKLSDAEVASVAVVANQIDISYAEIAKKNRTMQKS
jgi:putative membrane protein